MKTRDECSLLVRESLKEFYKGSDVDKRLDEFDSQIERIIAQAEEKGVSPIEALKSVNNDLVFKIEQTAKARLKNVELKKSAWRQIKQFNDDQYKGIQSLLVNQEGVKYEADSASIYGKRESIQNITVNMVMKDIRKIPGAYKRVMSGEFDLQVKKLLAGEVDQASMGKIDPIAMKYADSIRKMQDYLHQRKVSAGINVGYLKNRIAKQEHNAQGMIRMGEEKWKDLARNSFDWDKMGVSDIEARLDEIWGKKTRESGSNFWLNIDDDFKEVRVQSAIKNMEKSRSIEFKDAEAYHNYSKVVNGEQNFMHTLMREIEVDSGRVAAAEKLGPNFSANFRKIMEEAGDLNPAQRGLLEAQFKNTVYGSRGRGTSTLAVAVDRAKKLADMNKLSTAIASTMTDLSFGPGVISANSGKNYFQEAGSVLSNILKTIPNRKEVASDIGVFLQDAMDSTYTGRIEEGGSLTSYFDKMHNVFMKATGLPSQSHAFRTAYARKFVTHMGDVSNKEFSGLYKGMQNRMKKYGIGEMEWNLLREHAIGDLGDGRKAILPSAITDLDSELFGKGLKGIDKRNKLASDYNAMVLEMAEAGSPTPNSVTMAWRDATDPDSYHGAALRAIGQYKSFILSIGKTLKAIKGDDGYDQRSISRLSWTAISAFTIAYGVDYLKREVRGQEQLDMSKGENWAATFAKSGVGGIYADFLTTDYDSPWRNLSKDLAGPSIQVGEDAIMGTKGFVFGLYNAVSGDEKARKKNLRSFLKRAEANTPTLPFMKNVINKEIYTDMHKLLNTGARRK